MFIWYKSSLNLREKVLESSGRVLEFHIQLTVATPLISDQSRVLENVPPTHPSLRLGWSQGWG